jgi:hypothetical protein
MWILFMAFAAFGVGSMHDLYKKASEEGRTCNGLVIVGFGIYSGLCMVAAAISYLAERLH